MQEAEVVLDVLRERGRKGLPFTQLYRQMFNKDLYLLAYGNIYANQGAMTPGANEETADGMSEGKIDQIVEAMRCGASGTGSLRPAVPTSRRRMGSYAPSACHHGPINWSAKWSVSCWRRSSNHGSPAARTGSGKDADVIPRCGRSAKPGRAPCGSSRVTSPTASGLSTTKSYSGYWRRKSTTSGSFGLSETCSKPGTWKTGNTVTRSAAFRRAA